MTAKTKLNLAVCQMNSTDSEQKNFEQIQHLLSSLPKEKHFDLICFPENSLFMRIKEGQKISGLELSNPVFRQVSELAQQRKTTLHFGSLPLRIDGHLRNASVLVKPDGEVRPSYFKIHLFDIDLEGQAPVRESDIYKHGDEPQILDVEGWHLGQTICYDLRFSELFNYYAQHSVEIILVPASFLVQTGHAHWEVLLRARAIESQAYVIAAAQAGTHFGSQPDSLQSRRETYGHSLIIDPWGQILVEAKSMGPELMTFELDMDRVKAVRKQIPMRNHRRMVKMKR